jgi:tRNA(Ile)-lysidine synthase
MLEHLEAVLAEQCGLDKSRPILVGVSGGPDSLCLMQVLHEAGYPIILAHFNHRLRAESEAEAAAVGQIAARLPAPAVIEGGDVRRHADAHGIAIEEAARELRYRFLFQQARRLEAQAVAVGHTADDQVETVLMHLIRGAGLAGLKGMTYRTRLTSYDASIPVVRPLLDVWREDTVLYCAAHGLNPHFDPSNESLNFLRNRLRHLLIPTLETYNPRFREAVWRSARTLAADHALLSETVETAWKDCASQVAEQFVRFDLPRLSAQPPALQRHLIRRAVEQLQPGRETGYAVLERAAAFLAGSGGARTELTGGLHLFREDQAVYVAASPEALPLARWPQMPTELDSIGIALPSQTELAGGWRLTAELWRLPALALEQASQNTDRYQVWLDAGRLPENLELRIRRRGDVFEPAGLQGHSQKLSDFLINAKLPRRTRERWPLLCSGDQVIWVPGHRAAEPFQLRQSSGRIVYFALAGPSGRLPQ